MHRCASVNQEFQRKRSDEKSTGWNRFESRAKCMECNRIDLKWIFLMIPLRRNGTVDQSIRGTRCLVAQEIADDMVEYSEDDRDWRTLKRSASFKARSLKCKRLFRSARCTIY